MVEVARMAFALNSNASYDARFNLVFVSAVLDILHIDSL